MSELVTDLDEIKEQIERIFDIRLTKQKGLLDKEELYYKYKHFELYITLGNYSIPPYRRYISVGWEDRKNLQGAYAPCDSIEAVLKRIEMYGYPKREIPLQEQISLFEE